MSAPVRGRRPTRFTFNIPSPVHKQQQPQQHLKPFAHHPPPPTSFLTRKLDNTLTAAAARRRKVLTPHPIITHKQPTTTFVDYSLSLQFSPSFSPSSCVISDVPIPASATDSPMSEMRQQRWSQEMRRAEEEEEEEEGGEDDDQQHIMSPNMLSSSSCSFVSPITSASSLDDTPLTSPSPLSIQSPPLNQKHKSTSHTTTLPLAAQPSHQRVHSDPLPLPATTSTASVTRRLNLRPLVIPAGKDGDTIILLSALSPLPLTHLTDRQQSYDECEGDSDSGDSGDSGVEELLSGPTMSLADCWYGRSELMSPVTGSGMMHMAAQQQQQRNKSRQLPFSSFCSIKTAAAF